MPELLPSPWQQRKETEPGRRVWEIFYFIHIYGSLVLIVGLMYHADQGWYFMLPGLVLQFYERLWRLWKTSKHNTHILSLQPVSADIVKLRINIPNQHPKTTLGAYYFINIPSVAPMEWHPFSVCNALNSTYTEFYIKSIGDFSSKLFNFALNLNQQQMSLQDIDICCEGPFGLDIDYHAYNRLVLVAGGIGITPLHNLFFTLYYQALSNTKHNNNLMYMHQLPSIDLIWIARYAETFEMFRKSFDQYRNNNIPNMRITLYANREEREYDDIETGNEMQCPIQWRNGRPDLFQELRYLDQMKNKAIVYVCGPQQLVTTCQELAHLYGNHFKKETFLF